MEIGEEREMNDYQGIMKQALGTYDDSQKDEEMKWQDEGRLQVKILMKN